jgi:hypothetical protein
MTPGTMTRDNCGSMPSIRFVKSKRRFERKSADGAGGLVMAFIWLSICVGSSLGSLRE